MAAKKGAKRSVVYQFRIALLEIRPEIWRQIVVPERYTFWDLHVAIQDAMGWLDYHLHQFDVEGPARAEVTIGLPDEEFGEDILPGWEVGIASYFTRPGQSASYTYDFGDGWRHEVVLEGLFLGTPGSRYPACIAGARACPPEDCGGSHGLKELNKVLANSRHKQHREMAEWVEGQGRYRPYHPEEFALEQVRFDNPKTRWKRAFEGAR